VNEVVYNGRLVWYDVLLIPHITQACNTVNWGRCWHFAQVDCISCLSGSVELTLHYTMPDIHCRHRQYKCNGGICCFICRSLIDTA